MKKKRMRMKMKTMMEPLTLMNVVKKNGMMVS